MSVQQLTYSFADVTASITGPGGSFPLGAGAGIAEEGITIEYDKDKGSLVAGADGTPQHSLHAANTGTATIRVLKTSPVNSQLSAMYNFQKLSSANWGQNTITITDAAWGDAFNLQSVAFKKFTPITYTVEAGMNTWEFLVGIIDPQLGDGTPITTVPA